jgi:hypothetical protein
MHNVTSRQHTRRTALPILVVLVVAAWLIHSGDTNALKLLAYKVQLLFGGFLIGHLIRVLGFPYIHYSEASVTDKMLCIVLYAVCIWGACIAG